jgi:hypothetical protein
MRRLLPLSLAFTMLFVALPDAHAQLGGLVKKKATEKVTGKKDTVATAGAKPAKAKCDASKMVITSDVVDRYLRGFAARDAMEQKLAKEPGPTGAYYAAVFKRQALEKRKLEFDLRRGPDWQKYEALQKRVMEGDTSAITAYATFPQSIDPNSVEIPQLAWEDQQKANARMDSTVKATGKFSDCDWLDLGERFPRIVAILIQDPNARDFQGWGTASEGAAVKPRVVELGRALGFKAAESPEVTARRAQLAREDSAKAAAPPTSGNAYVDCLAKVQGEYLKAHQKEFDAASEKEDVAVLMQLSQAATAEAMRKCPSQ